MSNFTTNDTQLFVGIEVGFHNHQNRCHQSRKA